MSKTRDFPFLAFLACFLLVPALALGADKKAKPPKEESGGGSGDCVVNSYLLGADEKVARQCDRALIGIQHWYAKFFDGRTFKFTPTKIVKSYSEIPHGPKSFTSGGPNAKGSLRVIFDNSYTKRYPEGLGAGDNAKDDEGGTATYGVKMCLTPVFKHDHAFGGEERAWYVLTHELGHALRMLHVGANGDLMQKPAYPCNPYDPKLNKIIVGTTMKKELANKKFLLVENDPQLTDQEVLDIIDGKGSDEDVAAYGMARKKGTSGGRYGAEPKPGGDASKPKNPKGKDKKPPKKPVADAGGEDPKPDPKPAKKGPKEPTKPKKQQDPAESPPEENPAE